ncbi:hypothetical protein [Mycobacterium sp. CnD-18-1]|uniref:hypothetical protein n=1 Tax=Mycobacterium sp. CnD-18-1 TaxID=2917744 RepID=UPI001EF16819|nr:hypothetical protein [Mycobacterium sp. CnD-18-1]MCG7607069.1 hypothetical protein [Mycobacterium sp. CnD-18-1]
MNIFAPLVRLFIKELIDYLLKHPEVLDSFADKLTEKLPDFSNVPKEVVSEVGEFVNTVTERLVPDVNSLASEVAKRIPGLDGVTSLLARFGIK